MILKHIITKDVININTKPIVLDINKKFYDILTAKQGDTKSRFLFFKLLDRSIPLDLLGKKVICYLVKPDSKKVFNYLVINDAKKGYCTLELTNQVLAVNGIANLELMITQEDKKLTTIPFKLEVVKSLNDGFIESTHEFNALMDCLASVEAWDKEFEDKSGKLEELYTPRLSELSSQMEESVKEINNIKSNYSQKTEVLTLLEDKAGINYVASEDEKLNRKIDEVAQKGTTVEVVRATTRQEIDRQVEDGTIANLTVQDRSITVNKVGAGLAEKLTPFTQRIIFDSLNINEYMPPYNYSQKKLNSIEFSLGKYYYTFDTTGVTGTPSINIPLSANDIAKLGYVDIEISYKSSNPFSVSSHEWLKTQTWGDKVVDTVFPKCDFENSIKIRHKISSSNCELLTVMLRISPNNIVKVGRVIAYDHKLNKNIDATSNMVKVANKLTYKKDLSLEDVGGQNKIGVTIENNTGEFLHGYKYLKCQDSPNVTGIGYWIDIPEEYQEKKKGARVKITYKSLGSSNMKVYFNDGTSWLDIANNFVDIYLPSTRIANENNKEYILEKSIYVDIPEIIDKTKRIRVDFRGKNIISLFMLNDIQLFIKGFEEPLRTQLTTITKTVGATGCDFIDLSQAIVFANSVTDVNTKIVFTLKKGSYSDGMINITRDNILIQGEGHENTIIRFNGTTHSQPDQAKKHGMSTMANVVVNDICIDVNDSKYAIHNDASIGVGTKRAFKAIFNRCRFTHRGTTCKRYYHPVGLGLFGGQYNHFVDCIFEYIGSQTEVFGVLFHNWNNQTSSCGIVMLNSKTVNCGICTITEIGSGQLDNVIIRNPKLPDGKIKLNATNGYYVPLGTPIENIPYSIQLVLEGKCTVEIDRDTRPLYYKYI